MKQLQPWLSSVTVLFLSINTALAENINQEQQLMTFGSANVAPVPSILSTPPALSFPRPVPAPKLHTFAPNPPRFIDSLPQLPPQAAPTQKAVSPVQNKQQATFFNQPRQAIPNPPTQAQLRASGPPLPGFDYDIFLKSIEAEMQRLSPSAPAPATQTMAPAPTAPSNGISDALTEQLSKLVSLQTTLQANLQKSQQQSNELNLKYQNLLNEQSKGAALTTDLNSQLQELHSSNQALNLKITEQLTEIDALKVTLTKAAGENASLSQHSANIEKERNALFQKLQETLQEQEVRVPLLDKASSQLRATQEELKNTKSKLLEFNNQATESAGLASQLTAANNEISQLKQALTAADAKGQSSQSELTSNASKLAKSTAMITGLQLALSEAKSIPDRTEEVNALQLRMQQSEQTLAESLAQLEALQNEKIALETQLAESTGQLELLSGEKQTIETQLTEALATPDLSGEIKTLQDELSLAQENITQRKIELDAAAIQVQTLQTELDTANAQIQSLQTELDTSNSQAQSLQTELDASMLAAKEAQLNLENTQAQLNETMASRDKLTLLTQDTDKDGLNDAEDQCPNTAKGAPVDETGCLIDSDNDGITDSLDLCTNSEPGQKVDNLGCEPDSAIVLEGLTFKTGSSRFNQESLLILSDLLGVLNQFPELELEITGHTDNIGIREQNISLSKRRANAVRDHLIEQGIDASRLLAEGYGPDEPVGDNETTEGRELNRRVQVRRR